MHLIIPKYLLKTFYVLNTLPNAVRRHSKKYKTGSQPIKGKTIKLAHLVVIMGTSFIHLPSFCFWLVMCQIFF
jgi:hypothetical protein